MENIRTAELSEKQIEAGEYLQMGQTLLGAEKFKEAIEKFDKSLKCDPMNKITYISEGIAYANLEDYDRAKKCFHKAIKIDKNFPDGYFQLGNIYFLEGDFEKGLKNYNQALFLGYNNEGLYYNLGLAYEEREEYEEAVRNYSKAISMNEMEPVYMIRKASLQIMMGKCEEALQTLEKLRMHCPESFDGYHLTAAAYTLLGKYEEANKALEYAQRLFPDDKDLLFDRMRVLVTQGSIEEALKLLERAQEMECTDEEKKEVLLNKGKIYIQKENLEEAVREFVAALAIPGGIEENGEIQYLLMNCYLLLKDYENLLKVSRSVDRKNTDNAYNLCGMYFECMALKLMESGDFQKTCEDAVRYYRSISLKEPSRIDVYLFRAMCYKELKEYEKAIESVDYVLLLQPDNAQLHQIKGNILSEMPGKEAEAQKEYEAVKGLGGGLSFLGGDYFG